MARPEIYVSTDVETDGPIPGPHSMLSFASAAYTADKDLLGTFSANLVTLPGATGEPATMTWWATQPEAWAACRADQEEPTTAMARLLHTDYRSTVKRAMPRAWFDNTPHSHIALDDAIEQGALFCAMLAANQQT